MLSFHKKQFSNSVLLAKECKCPPPPLQFAKKVFRLNICPTHLRIRVLNVTSLKLSIQELDEQFVFNLIDGMTIESGIWQSYLG